MEIQETKRRRFRPWENLRRLFQRRNSSAGKVQAGSRPSKILSGGFFAGLAGSRSTSVLVASRPIRISTNNASSGDAAGSLSANGLSVSHDSVFDANKPESSLPSNSSMKYMQNELRAAVRHRSDDEGFPRSPANTTPTTAQVLAADCSIRSGGGSDPSLLSINSCDLEEAPFASLHNRSQQPTSQASLQVQRAGNNESIADGYKLMDPVDDGTPSAPLNHSAARHKISIRPKRNHAPGRPARQLPQLSEASADGVEWPVFEDVQPVAPERNRRSARLAKELPIATDPLAMHKQRSVSLSRTQDCIEAAPAVPPSSAKLARSKSSVEKKLQHEVAGFWRRTKESSKLFNKKEEPDKDQEVPAVEPETKRKDLRKIKRDREEKRKKSDSNDSSPPPFLSRFFGSRRSSRRSKKSSEPSTPPPASILPEPKPRTIFDVKMQRDDEEMEVDWTMPPPSARLAPKTSPLPTRHHRIHIAGLSPYQRRVARIGNDLEISDDEWDGPAAPAAASPTRSYHFRPDARRSFNRSDLSLQMENASLPVSVNHDFILKKASPNRDIRRSFEILKFSSEGIKKTIDSLNSPRMSQSSDQLHLSDGSGQRESSGSVSNSTSSLNISDADDVLADGSLASLAHSVEEKDVRDDVLIIDDHKGQESAALWPKATLAPVVSLQLDPEEPMSFVGCSTTDPTPPSHPECVQTRPMFSMSVRVQNPPDAGKFKRSISEHQPASMISPSLVAETRKTAYNLDSQQWIARISARPCQSKEEKERQNKVELERALEPEPEVKLRVKKPADEQTSELLKVFARRSLKVRVDGAESEEDAPPDNPPPKVKKSPKPLPAAGRTVSQPERQMALPDDSNRTVESSPPADDVWKRIQATKPAARFANNHKVATTDEVKAVSAPVRQSKVLDMVHNFQRLQVT